MSKITEDDDGELLIDGKPVDFSRPWEIEAAIRQLQADLNSASSWRQPNAELLANQLAAENVRRLLDGTIIGAPEPGTLAARVHERIELIKDDAAERAECSQQD